jgi:antitoxin (DNA-binding transcriptional repressor) of toxin-antitoxin stability system
MRTVPLTVGSDEARTRFRELLDHTERGGEVRILRYQRPVAVMTRPEPNPLDDRILAMAEILREAGNADVADEIESHAAYIREALAGSDDGEVADGLELISAYAAELAEIVRAQPSAARMVDHPHLRDHRQ